MHVVFDAADDDWLGTAVGEDAAEVSVRLSAQVAIMEEGVAVFGGEDHVDQDFGEGLGHGRTIGRPKSKIQPFQGCISWRMYVTQGSPPSRATLG